MSQKAVNTLEQALNAVKERAKTYGNNKEILKRIRKRWSTTLGFEITNQEVLLCMIDLKIARYEVNNQHLDNIVDICGYASLLADLEAETDDK